MSYPTETLLADVIDKGVANGRTSREIAAAILARQAAERELHSVRTITTHTSTYTTYFDVGEVDRLVGGAHRALESDFERRRDALSSDEQRAMESRLAFLRAAWMLLLERAP